MKNDVLNTVFSEIFHMIKFFQLWKIYDFVFLEKIYQMSNTRSDIKY